MDFGRYVEVSSLKAIVEMMAVASFPQAPYISTTMIFNNYTKELTREATACSISIKSLSVRPECSHKGPVHAMMSYTTSI